MSSSAEVCYSSLELNSSLIPNNYYDPFTLWMGVIGIKRDSSWNKLDPMNSNFGITSWLISGEIEPSTELTLLNPSTII